MQHLAPAVSGQWQPGMMHPVPACIPFVHRRTPARDAMLAAPSCLAAKACYGL